jgi:uncharacterized membrane protein YhaH (DUF805 family)
MEAVYIQTGIIITLGLLFSVLCGGLSAYIAHVKERKSAAWFCAGLFFGIVALLVIALLPGRGRAQEKGYFIRRIKALWKRITQDDLLKNILYIRNEIDGKTFLALLLLRTIIISLVHAFISSFVVFSGLTFYFAYNLFDMRIRSIYKKNSFIALLLAAIFTINAFLSYYFILFAAMRLPPEMIYGDMAHLGFYEIVQTHGLFLNYLHLLTVIITIPALVLCVFLKEKNTSQGFRLRYKASSIKTNLIRFKGSSGRVCFVFMNFFYNLMVIMVILLNPLFLYLKHGGTAFKDTDTFLTYTFKYPSDVYLVLVVVISVLAFISSSSLIVRRLHDFKRSGFWVLLLYPLIALGTILYPRLVDLLGTNLMAYYGQEYILYFRYAAEPFIYTGVNLIRSFMFIALLVLFLIPGKKEMTKQDTKTPDSRATSGRRK